MYELFRKVYTSLGGCCCQLYVTTSINGYIMENFDFLIKVIKYTETNPSNLDKSLIESVHNFKMRITQEFIDEIGKNSVILFFRRFTTLLKNEDIFSKFCEPTNLYKNLKEKENVYSHMLEELERLIYTCQKPSILLNALIEISDETKDYRLIDIKQICSAMSKCILNSNDYSMKEEVFKKVYNKFLNLITGKEIIYNMPKMSVLFQPFLDCQDPNILKIYYDNNFFNAGEILMNGIKKLMSLNFTGYNLEYIVDILNSLVLIGEKVKNEPYAKNVNPVIEYLKKNNAKEILSKTSYADNILEFLK
jgi:hypothetical protein